MAQSTSPDFASRRAIDGSGDDERQSGPLSHNKGKDYIDLGVGRHSETDVELAAYRQDYGKRGLWVRPLAMFEESIEVDGEQVPRFPFVGEE